MRKHSLNYVIVGGFVLAMVVSALVLGALLAGRVGARDTYFTVLDNVADVGFGTQVRYEGYPVGQVEDIAPIAEGARMRFRVALSVTEGWRIPADSVARIGSTSFLAAKTIDIESGRADSAIAPGGEIPSGAPSDMFAAMASVAAEVGDLSRLGVRPLVERLGDIAVRTGATLEGLVTRLDSGAAALEQVLSSRNAVAVEQIIANAEETSRNLASTSGRLAQSMADIDRLMATNRDDVDRSLKDAQHTLGAIAQNIDTLVHNLDGAARNMNEFSRLIRQNPGLLLNGTPREEVSAPYGLGGGAVP